MQRKAELSLFDDSALQARRAAEQAAYEAVRQPVRQLSAVPGTDQVVYEPAHSKADWAGLVSRDALERAHFSAPAAQRESFVRAGDAIVPSEDVPTLDSGLGAGKRHYQHDLRFTSKDSAPLMADATFFVAGGQADRFQSVYQAQTSFQPTPQDSFRAAQASKGRKHVVPLYEQSLAEITNQRLPRRAQEEPSARQPAAGGSGTLVGYRAPAFKAGSHGGSSMLANIGAQVARALPDRPTGGGAAHAQGPRAGESGCLMENYIPPSTIPGYTGRARRG